MNPELQRNLWLEASPRRIAWAAVVLVLIYGAAAAMARDNPERIVMVLGGVGLAVFLGAAIWGARAAAGSVLTEIADRTWEFQRLSALSPWSMTWGKLVGASSLAWLCGLTGLALMIIAALDQGQRSVGPVFLALLAGAVLLQAVSLAAALVGVRKARAEGRVARAGGVLGGLVLGAFLFLAVARSSGFQHGAGIEGLSSLWNSRAGLIPWGSGFHPADSFRAVGLTLFAAWAVVACWRLMRLELQMENPPVAWPAFLAFLAVFVGGFVINQGLSAAFTVAALAVALCAYAGAFAEPADRVRMRQFGQAVARRDFARAAPLVPAPLAPAVLATLLVLAGYAAKGAGPAGIDLDQAAALIAFLARDLGVIALCRLGARPTRGDFNAVLALALLYGVGGIIGGATAGQQGTALFMPADSHPLTSLASGLAQAAGAWVLAAARIRGGRA